MNRWLKKLVGSSKSQSTDKNETTMGDSEQTVPTSELRVTIAAEMLKEALSDHKVGKGSRRVLIQKVGCADVSLDRLSR